MDDELLTIRDMAASLKVTENTVYGLALSRRIPTFKVGGQWRLRRRDIDAWIAAQTDDVPNAPPAGQSRQACGGTGRARRSRSGR